MVINNKHLAKTRTPHTYACTKYKDCHHNNTKVHSYSLAGTASTNQIIPFTALMMWAELIPYSSSSSWHRPLLGMPVTTNRCTRMLSSSDRAPATPSPSPPAHQRAVSNYGNIQTYTPTRPLTQCTRWSIMSTPTRALKHTLVSVSNKV